MIFGSIDELSEVSDRSLKLGRLVAVNQFTKALVRHGHFEEYRFYCSTQGSLDGARKRLETALQPEELERISLTLVPNFHADLASAPFGVVHSASGWTALSNLAPVRNQFAPSPFPLTCLIHSLNDSMAYLKALKISLSYARPFDAIIATSEAGKRALQSFFEAVSENCRGRLDLEFPGVIAKIPLGVDQEIFRPLDRAACRETLGLPPRATVLLHLGRLSAHDKSDPGPLFYLFQRLAKGRPALDLRLLLAGGAEPENVQHFEATCRELGIADRVIFRPNFEDEEKPLLYGAADIFLSLADSLQETFGISVVEAMASGKPVVVSDFDGYRDLVEDGRSGFLVPTYWGSADGFLRGIAPLVNSRVYQLFLSQSVVVDIGKLEATLLRLLDSPDQRPAIGEAARRRAVERFSWKTVIGQYEQLWKELGERAQSAPDLPDPPPDPFAVDYFRCFSHYPTRLVEGSWRVSLTPFGKEAIAGAGLPAIYRDVGILLSEEWLKHLLQSVVAKPVALGALLASAREKLGAPEEHILYHILWLAKYDVLALEPT